jgi:hypothetical protein
MSRAIHILIMGHIVLLGTAGWVGAEEIVKNEHHLIFGIGLHDEGSWTPVGQSDGVTFIVEIRHGDQVKEVFRKHKPKENHSPEYFSVDLSSWRDQVIGIRFIADPGPNNNAAYDWGVWIEPRVAEGKLPGKWWQEKNLFGDGKLKVVFDAIDAYDSRAMTTGVGDKAEMRAGAQFNPATVPLGWNILPWAEKYCGKQKVRGIFHEPAWDNEATASWGQYTIGLGEAKVVATTQVTNTDVKKQIDQEAQAREQLKQAQELSAQLITLIEEGKKKGLQMRLPRVTAAVLKVFIPRMQEDLDGMLHYCGPNFPGWFYDGGKAEYHLSVFKLADQPNKFSPEYIAERKQRGITLSPYLVQTARRAIDEAKAILADPKKDVRYPEYKIESLKIRDGYFYQGNDPAILAGLYTNRDVRDDYDVLAEMGVCFTQPERLNVFTTLVSEKETNRAFIDGYVVRDTLVPAGKANVGCLFDIGLHYMPDWAYAKYPDMFNPGSDHNHYSPYMVCSKSFRELTQKYLDELIPTTAKYPMTMGYEMGNQPYLNPWSPAVIKEFQAWAKSEYKAIEAVNAKWHSSFASFEAIQPDKNFRKIEPLGFRYDWINFQHSITSEWYRWFKAELNKRDPGRPVEVQPAGNFFEPQKFAGHDWHRVAIDDVDMYQNITDISGFDACTWYWGRLVFDQIGQFVDLMRSIAPNKPAMNFEYAFGTYNSKAIWNPDYIRASLWYSYLHGMAGSTSWIWTVAEELDDSQNNSFAHWPDRMEQFGRATLELRRHAKEIVAFGRPESQVAILYSSPSRYFAGTGSNEYFEQARAIWSAASFLDASLDFIADEHIAQGKLSQYKVLIVPASPYVQDETLEKILDFVRRGGTLVMNTGSLAFDPYANARSGGEMFGKNYTVWDYAAEKRSGKACGRGVIYAVDPAEGAGYYPMLNRIYTRAGVDRPIRVTMSNGMPTFWTVEARTVKEKGENGRYLFYCFNLGNQPVEVSVKCKKGFGIQGNDLVEGRAFEDKMIIKPLGIYIWTVCHEQQ